MCLACVSDTCAWCVLVLCVHARARVSVRAMLGRRRSAVKGERLKNVLFYLKPQGKHEDDRD